MTDLERLAAAIDAGEFPDHMTGPEMGFPENAEFTMFSAYNGSLDAAKALHDAVLPGWRWTIWKIGGIAVWNSYSETYVADCDDNPARAWLLAIVRALIAKEGKE